MKMPVRVFLVLGLLALVAGGVAFFALGGLERLGIRPPEGKTWSETLGLPDAFTGVQLAVLAGCICAGMLGYFFPTVVAFASGNHQAVAIFVLNLLLGWTFLGWALALVWAVMRPPVVYVLRGDPPSG